MSQDISQEIQSSLKSDPDWTSIRKFQNGDASAFNLIFDKHKRLVFNLAFRFVRHRELAEDIAQDIFLKLYERKYRVEMRAKFSTWLYKVTVNASLDALRKRRFFGRSLNAAVEDAEGRQSLLMDKVAEDERSIPDQLALREEIQTLVQREIDKLPEKFRAPILLYQFQEMAYREIAEILNISEKAVERRIYHAKERLRKKLAPFL